MGCCRHRHRGRCWLHHDCRNRCVHSVVVVHCRCCGRAMNLQLPSRWQCCKVVDNDWDAWNSCQVVVMTLTVLHYRCILHRYWQYTKRGRLISDGVTKGKHAKRNGNETYLLGRETTAKSDRRNPLLARISSKLGGWHDRNGLVLFDPISTSVPQSESKDLNPFDVGSGFGSSTNVSRSRSGLIVIIIPRKK